MTKKVNQPTELSDTALEEAQGGIFGGPLIGTATANIKDLEAEDRLGNFEIQDLMSRFNQAETMASSVQKKQDDTANAVIGKIG